MKYSSLSIKLVSGLVLLLATGTVWVNSRRGRSTSLSNDQFAFSHSDPRAHLSGMMADASLTARSTTDTRKHTKTEVSQTYGKLPLGFEANRGQVDRQVKFLSRGNGYALFLTSTEAVLHCPLPTLDRQGKEQKVPIDNQKALRTTRRFA
jgi:hypothetical protein